MGVVDLIGLEGVLGLVSCGKVDWIFCLKVLTLIMLICIGLKKLVLLQLAA